MKKIQTLSAFVPLLLALTFASAASAAEDSASGSSGQYTPSKKFHRGVHNTVTGWMEAPVTVDKFQKERNWFEALTTGLTRGVGLAIARTGVGIYEAATFPFEAPERFEPLMMPERV